MKKSHKDETTLVTAGREPFAHFGAVNTPVFRASTILFPTHAALKARTQPFIYGRRATPTTRALEEALTELESGTRTVLVPSGLAACTLALLSFCKAGDHIVVSDGVYGPTRHFCDTILRRWGIETTYVAPCDTAAWRKAIRANTALFYLESPSSLTFEVQDLPLLAAEARPHGIKILIDNTWATPLLFKPLELGADIVIEAITKYIGGHSDLTMGSVTANKDAADALLDMHGHLGLTVGGDDAYLALRGLRTLATRLKRHAETGLTLARWLGARPEVTRVLHPALPDDPGHEIWRRDFRGTSGLFAFELKPCPPDALSRFLDGLQHFGMGYSWGGFESLIVPAQIARTAAYHAPQGPLLRISAGLEEAGDLIADLEAAFARFAAP